MAGKGDKPRPLSVSRGEYEERWASTFGGVAGGGLLRDELIRRAAPLIPRSMPRAWVLIDEADDALDADTTMDEVTRMSREEWGAEHLGHFAAAPHPLDSNARTQHTAVPAQLRCVNEALRAHLSEPGMQQSVEAERQWLEQHKCRAAHGWRLMSQSVELMRHSGNV